MKIRGFRVELGEIQAALARHPAVRECVVTAREEDGDRQLVAYVVWRPGQKRRPGDLRRFLQEKLPGHMVPGALVSIDALPISPNGKIDQRALPAPPETRAGSMEGWVPPRTPIEEGLAEIFGRVLGVEAVGVHDDFFELGGHSLLATRAISQLRSTYQVELPLRALFEDPTVEGLARRIEAARGRGGAPPAPEMRPVGRNRDLPLSFAQQRLWFLDQMGAGAAYNIPLSLRLQGRLNLGALEGSLNSIISRHEALRTTFPAVEGRPAQVIAPELELRMATADFGGHPESEREREARRFAVLEAERPFDLATGPLVRATLLRLAEEDHALLLTIHHIVADGWSMGVLTRELAAQYAAHLTGGQATLPELSVQYADFAHWQRGWLQGEVLREQLGYWRQRLGGDLPRLELPTDRPRPAVQTYRGGIRSISFPPALAEGLATLCRREGATLFMSLLAGFKALLQRYTGQDDVVVGSPIANRNRIETEALIGFFVNSQALRTSMAGNPSFRDLLTRVKETALGAYDHQDLPFETLVDELGLGRDLSQNPIFQVVFAVQNAPWEPPELPGLTLSPFLSEAAVTRFDLEVHVWEQRGVLTAAFSYNADLFDAATVDRIGHGWLTLLEAACARPETRIGALPLLGAQEREEVLGLGVGDRAAYPRESTVHREFEAQAFRTPDAVAVVWGGERLTYSELDRRANQLAQRLVRAGVAPGARVGICVERSLDLVVGLVGILKAGGAYVPLDPDYPRPRLAFMLADARPAALLTQERLLGRLPVEDIPVVCLDRDDGIAAEPTEAPRWRGTAEDLAYVTYTSGSTGVPKGVEVRHRGILRLVLGADYARLSAGETLLQLAPVSFDASTLEVWGALLVGGRCVVYPDRVPTTEELGQVLTREGVSTLWLTASLFNAVVDEASEALLPVRQLLIGGEALSVGHVRKAQDRLPRTQIINGYGPTESTTFTCCYPIPAGLPEGTKSIPIGRPIANTDVFVLDPGLEPVPVGVAGELFIGGDGLARGYLNRPELTAERFVPNPFGERPGERLYRTGDSARWRGDGTIEFLGRRDDQVKIRGFRVELGEVQAVLARHPAVKESVVLVKEGRTPGDKRLVAYVVAAASGGEAAHRESEGREGRVDQWRKVYESVIYDQIDNAGPADPTLNLAGWNSTYTGLPIPEVEMREQVEQAVARILSARPRRVLEIGCGTGLLLFRVAPHCERYVGTDFSNTAIEYLRGQLGSASALLPQVALLERRADDFSGLEAGSFDAVVLNSVVQYFPDLGYLRTVLEAAVRALAPGGRLFVGDVRHLPLLETFAAAVQLHQTPPGTSKGQVRERVRDHLAQEQELLVDPAFFVALARSISGVAGLHVSPKRGRARNELTKYRYDAVLEIGPPPEEELCTWLDWEEDGLNLPSLRRLLAETEPGTLGVLRVPNARIRADLVAARWLGRDDDAPPEADDGGGVDPEELWGLDGELPYRVDLSWGSSHPEGRYDALFRRNRSESLGPPRFPLPPSRPGTAHANNPLQATKVRGLVPELRRFLQERLPEYMVPSAFGLLDSLPLSPNGKVDTRALLARDLVRWDAEEAFEGPRTPVEEELGLIWAQVLGLPRVGIRDNFFELGGDSILSIQIIARANQAGLRLTPKQIFEHQTIAELAQVVGTSAVVDAEQGLVTGPVPLTPIQCWFLEQEQEEAHHFNQAALLELTEDLEVGVLEEAVRALEEHHDALRLRFERSAGGWRQELAGPRGDTFLRVDLSWARLGEEGQAVEEASAETQRGLNLAQGPLWRVALLELGGGRPRRLLIVIHHLAVDGVSWRVLLEDLDTACRQLSRGERLRLPRKTTSFRQWAEKLRAHAESKDLRGEWEYWREVLDAEGPSLPKDGPPALENTAGATRTVARALEPEETRALLQDVPGVYHTQITDVLLTALVRSFGRWTGRSRLLVDVEGHGREELFEGVDLSRTVGWFTSLYPVRLELAEGGAAGEALKSVKEQLRGVPRRGIGYGLLRYLARGQRLWTSPGAEVSFNYLGQFDQAMGGLGLFAPGREGGGESRSPKTQRCHRLEVNALVTGGSLRVGWTYLVGEHLPSTIEALALGFEEELRAILAHCRSPEAGGHTPSDFPLAGIDQPTLDRVLNGDPDAEDVYPLSPMQQGMLFHTLLDPAAGVYFEQLSLELQGPIDVPALALAWQHLVDRHPVLRSRFVWEGLARPLQVVQRRAALDWEDHDWRALPAASQRERLEELLVRDRGRGLDPARCPLMRVALVRTAEETHRLIWSFHHIVLDGWCLSLVLKDLSIAYDGLRRGEAPNLPPLRPYREYVGWLEGQDMAQAEAYWRATLKGFTAPTPLPLDRAPGRTHETGAEVAGHAFHLSSAATAALKSLGRRYQITLNTIVQGAWALLLSRWSGEQDVVFGVNVSGRPPALPGVESMVGLFVNTLPMRVRVPAGASLLEWLRQLQAQQIEQRQYEYSPLVNVQAWSDVPAGRPLFESIFAFENFPLDASTRPLGAVTDVRYQGVTNYPLSVIATPGPRLSLRIDYDRRRIDPDTVARLEGHLTILLEGLAADPERSLAEVPLLTAEESRRLVVEWNETRVDFPEHACVHHLVEAQVDRTPEALAVVGEGGELTYGELDRKANQLAHHLLALGVGPETRVGLCLERSPELVIALLAVLKAGAAYVPLDPAYPSQRLAFMLADAEVAVLLTQHRLAGQLPPVQVPLVCLDSGWEPISRRNSTRPAVGVMPENLAYLIYTSGSTGRPKGVMLPHRGVVNYLHWAARTYAAPGAKGAPVHSSLAFDLTVTSLFCPLLAGQSVVLLPEDGDVQALGAALRTGHDFALVKITPAHLELIGHTLSPGEAAGRARAFVIGGEALWAEGLSFWRTAAPGTRLINEYGPTETVVGCCVYEVPPDLPRSGAVPIGRPIANTRLYVLDANLQPVPAGAVGELYIGGAGLARGYWERPDLTAERFIPDPFGREPGQRLYRTGDLVRLRPDGNLEYLGRRDSQVKLRGFRIELGEIEAVLGLHPLVRESVVLAREDSPGDRRLVAYVVPAPLSAPSVAEFRAHLREHLPEHMVPAAFVMLERLPLTPNGKVDRRALPLPEGRIGLEERFIAPRSSAEQTIAAAWRDVLKIERVGVQDNFFDLGGHSLLLLQVHAKLRHEFPRLSVVDLFRYPTVKAMAAYLSEEGREAKPLARGGESDRARSTARTEGVAIVGMAGRFPGAPSLDVFWRNLREGVESISFFTNDELRETGVPPEVLQDPRYVKARGVLEGAELFDAGFFGYNPREAEVIDPQQRVFLETAWEALERAGYEARKYPGTIGVYAGVGLNTYLNPLALSPDVLSAVGGFGSVLGSDKDFLATRASYKLDLRGPGVTVQTACSTSLVAVHLACQALAFHDCDMALAGGVSIAVPQKTVYRYEEEGILSADGHCRAFDARAQGTVAGAGVGVVVLKRLEDALRDGDSIEAVIRGTAINNDGSNKVGFTAPGVEGQAEVVALAQTRAGVEPETISYLEAHGTGTALGDPIEVEALTQVFRASTDEKGFCALGSVKTNVGHLDAAAGVAGLIKTVLALRHREVPPSLHYEHPNPKIDFSESPFYVNQRLQPWNTKGVARRAGVSSFGIGGTNAHVVLEEAPSLPETGPSRPWQLLVWSARSDAAAEEATTRLAEHLRHNPGLDLADVSWTLQVGRREFAHRRAVVVRDTSEAANVLSPADPKRLLVGTAPERGEVSLAFLFPGQGAQHVGMCAELLRHEEVFRSELDRCAEMLVPELGLDLRELLNPRGDEEKAARRLRETRFTQPVLFSVSWALTRLWDAWGVRPSAMLGHSVGEYVAACASGVMSFEDALRLVAIRGALMQALAPGAMTAVGLPEAEIRALLDGALDLAAVNGPRECVVSGPEEAVAALEARLESRGLPCERLATSHAFHSAMMNPILERFREAVEKVELRAPRIPFVSNLTGTWIRPEEATDPTYWVRHLRGSVRFFDGLGELLRGPRRVVIEVGPGQALAGLTRRHPACSPDQIVLSSARHAQGGRSDEEALLVTLGRLWLAGVDVDWRSHRAGERRRRLALPTYPFQRQRYWLDRSQLAAPVPTVVAKKGLEDWFYVPSWKRSRPALEVPAASRPWLVLADECGLGVGLVGRLRERGQETVVVTRGPAYEQLAGGDFRIQAGRSEDYGTLVRELAGQGRLPGHVVHLWGVTPKGLPLPSFEQSQDVGLFSLVSFAQALGLQGVEQRVQFSVLTSQMQEVSGEGLAHPEKATVLGPCLVIPQEYPGLRCRSIDIVVPSSGSWSSEELDAILAECGEGTEDAVVALRGIDRWVRSFEPVRLERRREGVPARLRARGVYLITGGLGGIGLELAEYLARSVKARLVLLGRSGLPPRAEWDGWLSHGDGGTRRRIERVRTLEALGAEVLILQADVSHRAEMEEALRRTEERFGCLNGVIHAAGTAPGGVIQLKAREVAEEVLAPKVKGALILDELLSGKPLDFLVLCSSLASVLGGAAQFDYVAANAFLDALARRNMSGRGPFTVAINWDTWAEVGMAVESTVPADLAEARRQTLGLGILSREGAEVFARTLDQRLPQVLTSVVDLAPRLAAGAAPRAESPASGAGPAAARHARPDLSDDYVAPRNEVERAIVEIWQQYLGFERIGVRDSFFDLGGHSLLATRIVNRLRETFQVPLRLEALFEAPTVAELAAVILEREAQPGQATEIARLLEGVGGMSMEEVRAILLQAEPGDQA
ncbi:MAG TPA: amino acid adenylation domain-containing protein [Vicinamibacteria bacterium]|nr:amino acid adenylation domain-containing protein [Vicinamibacteria bacterium]